MKRAIMSEREAKYYTSPNVDDLLPETMIAEMISKTIDVAFDQNLNLNGRLYAKRFNVFLVNGKLATGGKLVEALKNDPKSVSQQLPIVGITEEKGYDIAYIVFQSELGKGTTPFTVPIPQEIMDFLNTPPNMTVEDLIEEAKRH